MSLKSSLTRVEYIAALCSLVLTTGAWRTLDAQVLNQPPQIAVPLTKVGAGTLVLQVQGNVETRNVVEVITADQAENPPPKPANKPGEKEKAKNDGEKSKPEPATPSPAATPADPEIIKLHLMDGSIITGKLAVKELAVETEFGALNVPVSSIRSFTPGLSSHPSFSKQIGGWIQALGSANFNEREKAQQQLERFPALRSELEKHAKDSDTERRNRITAILNKFEDDADDDAGEKPWGVRERDVIETLEFTIVGKIVPQSFQVTSQYGPLTIKLSDIRGGVRETSKKEDVRQTVSVDAQNFAFKNPLDTKIRLERGDKVTITAEGTIHMNPWGNNAMATPEGNPQYGQFMGNQIPMGALVGRVGSSDQFQKFGNKFTLTVDKPGNLQLALGVMNDYNESQFPGKFTVKVHVVKRPDAK
ncbi:MAG: hypothetical protein QM811_06350 [Pirellulales bacterium]